MGGWPPTSCCAFLGPSPPQAWAMDSRSWGPRCPWMALPSCPDGFFLFSSVTAPSPVLCNLRPNGITDQPGNVSNPQRDPPRTVLDVRWPALTLPQDVFPPCLNQRPVPFSWSQQHLPAPLQHVRSLLGQGCCFRHLSAECTVSY